jgi:hypothetical protein
MPQAIKTLFGFAAGEQNGGTFRTIAEGELMANEPQRANKSATRTS